MVLLLLLFTIPEAENELTPMTGQGTKHPAGCSADMMRKPGHDNRAKCQLAQL